MDSTNLQPPGNYPDDWQRTDFDHFTTLKRGKDLTRDQFQEGFVPVAGSNGVIGYHDTANVMAPGVTVGRSGSVGRVTYYTQDFWAHNTALFATDFHGNDPRFAAYFLDFLKLGRFGSGVSVPTLDRNVFRMLPVVVPRADEQRKIAAVLGVVQRAIEQQERLLQLTAELKKTLLHQLFTHGLRGEPQKQTEIGLVPESWEVAELGRISHKPEYGFTESAKASGNAQFLRITDIQEDGVQWGSVPFCECPDDLIEKYLLADNDILFARIGATTGKNFLVKKPPVAVFASYLIRVRLKNVVSADFISQFCDTHAYWRQIDTNKGNNLKGGINSSTLKRLLVPVPPIREEQDEIAEVFRQIDTKAAYARRRRAALTALFRTLLHQLMTAQIRVQDLDLSVLGTIGLGGENSDREKYEP